jgi:hypothetical protein
MHQVIVAALIVVALVVLWYWGPFKREHADLSAPNFSGSLVDKYRDLIKDNRGMTLNDYALESSIVDSTPLSGNYKVL